MLPLHHVFMYGNEDRILELFLDVFPEALTVADDRGRLPLGCTPQDGSDNERRSNILDLYSKFMVELATKVLAEEAGGKKRREASSARDSNNTHSNGAMTAPRQGYVQQYGQPQALTQQRQPMQPLQRANLSLSAQPPIPSPDPVASLGIAPRYTATTDFNHVPYEAIRSRQAKMTKDIDDKSLTDIDKYASTSDEAENRNSSNLANIYNERAHLRSELLKLGGLDTIQEDGPEGQRGDGVKRVKKGLKKLFKRKTLASI
jgi:hypothetical protein